MIVPIGEWVLRCACLQNRAWHAAGLPEIKTAVNLSARQLRERRDAGMPPFAFQAIVRADARSQEAAQAFLAAAAQAARQAGLPHVDDVFLYPPIPMSVQRVANVERAQMLIESAQRPALLRFLWAWQAHLHWIRAQPEHRALVRWLVDVDPLAI